MHHALRRWAGVLASILAVLTAHQHCILRKRWVVDLVEFMDGVAERFAALGWHHGSEGDRVIRDCSVRLLLACCGPPCAEGP